MFDDSDKVFDDSDKVGAVVVLLHDCKQPVKGFLELNIAKTKELVLGGGKGRQKARPVSIHNQEVKIVNNFKYLGT